MGTLVGTNPQFDGSAKQLSSFIQQMLRLADAKDFTYMLEGGDIICKMFQEANAAAARSKTAGKTGTMSLDIESYEPKKVEAKFRKTSVLCSRVWLWQYAGIARKSSEKTGQTTRSAPCRRTI